MTEKKVPFSRDDYYRDLDVRLKPKPKPDPRTVLDKVLARKSGMR
jgi:hypothetical protein